MKHEYDAGTPELQAQKAAGELSRKGLDYLHRRKTLTHEQYLAGVHYRACFMAMHGGGGYRSCLAAHHMPEDPSYEKASEYWEKLMGMNDAKTWHMHISGKLARLAFYARKPYHDIVEHIAGHDDWNLDDVARRCGISKKETASRYTSQAFEALCKVIAELKDEWDENKTVANR